MPADVATLQARLDALKQAMASGRSEVSYGNRTVRYRSVAEMQAAIKDIESDIAGAQGTSIVRTFNFYTNKGL